MEINVTVENVNLSDEVPGQGPWNPVREDYDPLTIADLVAEKLVDRLIQKDVSGWYRDIGARVSRIIDEQVTAAVVPLIAESMTRPIRKTNAYGEPTGIETTMTELIAGKVDAWLTGPASENGGSYGERRTNAQVLVAKAVGESLNKELGDVIAAERKKIVNAVRDQAGRIIAEAVTKGVTGK